jgi:hypothetical protein
MREMGDKSGRGCGIVVGVVDGPHSFCGILYSDTWTKCKCRRPST